MLLRTEIFLAFIAIYLPQLISSQETVEHQLNVQPQQPNRYKRMYAMCPPRFFRIGSECYFISTNKVNWLEAHFECKDKNSKLAEPLKYEDKRLRKFLVHTDAIRDFKWIGGNYNWERHKWQWGYNGREIEHQSFSQMDPRVSQDLKHHCTVLNPANRYRWAAELCTEKHYYICQHRMPYVSSTSRARIYHKWNETYPNELANEVEVIVAGNLRKPTKDQYEKHIKSKPVSNEIPAFSKRPTSDVRPKRPRITPNPQARYKNRSRRPSRPTRARNEYISNDVIRQPVVEYAPDPVRQESSNGNGNSNKIAAFHGTRRHRPVTTTERPMHHEHPHRHHLGESRAETTTPRPVPTTTTPAPTTERTTTNAPTRRPKLSIAQQIKNEKKKKMSDLRDRLSRLSPEEQRKFFALRKERNEKKKQQKSSQNDTIP